MAGLFSTDTPTPTYVPLDSQSQGLLNSMQGNAQAPTQDWINRANQGVSSASQLGTQPKQNEYANLGVTPGMSNSLRSAYQGQANKQIGNIVNQNAFNAQIAKSNYAASINRALLGQAQTHVQNYQMLTDAYNQSEAARAQFVAQLSGLANYGMGMYAAKMTNKNPSQASPDQMVAINNNPMMFGGGGGGGGMQTSFNQPTGFNENIDSNQMY